MKKIEQLDNQQAKQISGGAWGYNKYPKETYHEACFITVWTKEPIKPDCFYLRLDDNIESIFFYESEANKYVNYYLTHTPEEYLKYIQINFPSCTKLIRGYDAIRLN